MRNRRSQSLRAGDADRTRRSRFAVDTISPRPSTPSGPFIDAHVHHWDPAKPQWYPYLAPDAQLPEMGLGDITSMKRLYDQSTYLAEARPWHVEGYVHVSAATAAGMHLPETDAVAELAASTGAPGAIIGAVNPASDIRSIAAELDRQTVSPFFRGIRVMEGLEYGAMRAVELLKLLEERELVYDLVVHPAEMLAAARTLEHLPDLSVVVEHAGGPTRTDDPDERAAWEKGIAVLAERQSTTAKLSGLPMVLHQISAAAFRPWFEHLVCVFGTNRVAVGSNFPVDGLYGTLPQLLDAYLELALPLGNGAVADLFAATARRVYLNR